MNIFGFFRKTAEKTESHDSVTLYLDEEIRKSKDMPLTNDTTAEMMIQSLVQTGELKRIYNAPNVDNLYLLLITRSSKSKILILKRRINPFENIKEIIMAKPDDQDYIWMLQMHNEPAKFSSFRESISGADSLNEPIFYEQKKASEPEKFERSGRLQKKNKKGEFKEKEFILYKDNLVYFKPGEKNKKVNVIPLVESRAEKNTLNSKEKCLFDIKTPDQTFHLKAKSDLDMRGWISAFNSQSAIATENTIMNNIDKEIKNLEYKFEKNRNEEIISLINNFEKLMDKQPYRSFLVEFFSKEKNYFKEAGPFLDILYSMRKEQNVERWVALSETLVMRVEEISVAAKNQEEKPENNSIETNFATLVFKKVTSDSDIALLKNHHTAIKAEFKPDAKEKITKIVDDMISGMLSIFKEKYTVLIQSDATFQQKLTDLAKRAFFQVHSFTSCTIFDVTGKRDTSNLSVPNMSTLSRNASSNSGNK